MDSYDFYQVDSTSKSSSRSGRQRHFYDEVQLELLDAEFARDSFPNREGRRRISQMIGVSEKSITWWFQNRRRRARQLGLTSRAAASIRQTTRQHRRSSPYVSTQQQDVYVSPQVQSTASFYSYPPAVPFLQPINYSTSDSSSSSTPQSGWIAAANCPQEVTQSNLNYSDGFQLGQQQKPQEPQQPEYEYSSYYWNNWEYSPPFYSSAMTNPAHLYSNTHPCDYSSSYNNSNYSPPETKNPFYNQSCM